MVGGLWLLLVKGRLLYSLLFPSSLSNSIFLWRWFPLSPQDRGPDGHLKWNWKNMPFRNIQSLQGFFSWWYGFRYRLLNRMLYHLSSRRSQTQTSCPLEKALGLQSEIPLWYGKRGEDTLPQFLPVTSGHTLYIHGSLLSMFKHAQVTPFFPQPLSLERILGSLNLFEPDGLSLANLPSAEGTSAPSMTVGEKVFSVSLTPLLEYNISQMVLQNIL